MSSIFIMSMATGYGGAERSVEIIAEHLPLHVQAYIYASHFEHLARLQEAASRRPNLRIVRLPTAQNINVRRFRALKIVRDYLRLRPDAVIANTNYSALLCAMAARAVPAMAQKTSLFVRDFMWHDLDYIFSRLEHGNVFVPNAVVLDRVGYLTPLYRGRGDPKTKVIPDMVELFEQPVAYTDPILHLASVNPWKGHSHLMLAVEHSKTAGRPVRVVSAGHAADRELLQRLHQLQDRLNIKGQFSFAEFVRDPSELLKQCRGVVVSSVAHSGGPETFGRTVIEAWSHRKPVIAFETGAPANLITHEEDGLLVVPEDTQALAQALHRLWADVELCVRLGEAGRRKVEQFYSAGAVTHRLLDALQINEKP